MESLELLLIALSLAMDAFSVSIAFGTVLGSRILNDAFKMAFSFGFFQAFMPILGWLAGAEAINLIAGIDHWIAFGLLFTIGLKMILNMEKPNPANIMEGITFNELLMLSVATSIDALAVGISFALLESPIMYSSIVIGTVAFAMSFIGVVLGKKLRPLLGNRIEAIGGAILIVIGIRILLEHL
ncbi:manganese efflux pump [Candidatus Bathyarchaeota archaeon]|nr:manganese efflux pump [Candidatus Bathyarchaeota archaeon]